MSDCLNSKGKLPQIITCQHVSDTRHQSTPDNRPPRIIITPSYERPPDIIQTPSIAKRTNHDDPGGEGTLDCGARIEYPNGINERMPGLQSRAWAFNGKRYGAADRVLVISSLLLVVGEVAMLAVCSPVYSEWPVLSS